MNVYRVTYKHDSDVVHYIEANSEAAARGVWTYLHNGTSPDHNVYFEKLVIIRQFELG